MSNIATDLEGKKIYRMTPEALTMFQVLGIMPKVFISPARSMYGKLNPAYLSGKKVMIELKKMLAVKFDKQQSAATAGVKGIYSQSVVYANCNDVFFDKLTLPKNCLNDNSLVMLISNTWDIESVSVPNASAATTSTKMKKKPEVKAQIADCIKNS